MSASASASASTAAATSPVDALHSGLSTGNKVDHSALPGEGWKTRQSLAYTSPSLSWCSARIIRVSFDEATRRPRAVSKSRRRTARSCVVDGLNGRGTRIFYGVHFQTVAGFRTKVVARTLLERIWRFHYPRRPLRRLIVNLWTGVQIWSIAEFLLCYDASSEKWRVNFSYDGPIIHVRWNGMRETIFVNS